MAAENSPTIQKVPVRLLSAARYLLPALAATPDLPLLPVLPIMPRPAVTGPVRQVGQTYPPARPFSRRKARKAKDRPI